MIAFYSATSYIGGFMRAANAIYDVPEGRPVWKTVPIQLAVTAVTGIFLAVSSLAVVFTGNLAKFAGRALGIEQTTVRVFDIAKWPVLVLGAGLLIALLYWAAPNARQGGFRWITPGSVLAVFVWLVVSVGFAFYIAKFDSYNKTYGALGGVIIFLVWLWLTNVADPAGRRVRRRTQPGPRDRGRPAERRGAVPAVAGRPALGSPHRGRRRPAGLA